MAGPPVSPLSTEGGTRVIPLGTGGYIPTAQRHTAAVLVRRGTSALLFDAGTGVARLLEPHFHAHLAGVKCLNIVLSHYHLDHVIGLTWLPKVWSSELRLYAPSHPLVDVRAEDALMRLTGAPLFALPLDAFPFTVHLLQVGTERELTIDDFSVRVLKQRHAGGSLGFRVDNCFAYITDTDPQEHHVPFLRGVDLAFMDAFYDAAEYRASRSADGADHGSSLTVAELAARANVRRLALIHINPSYNAERCAALLDEAKAIFEPCSIPDDGVTIET